MRQGRGALVRPDGNRRCRRSDALSRRSAPRQRVPWSATASTTLGSVVDDQKSTDVLIITILYKRLSYRTQGCFKSGNTYGDASTVAAIASSSRPRRIDRPISRPSIEMAILLGESVAAKRRTLRTRLRFDGGTSVSRPSGGGGRSDRGETAASRGSSRSESMTRSANF